MAAEKSLLEKQAILIEALQEIATCQFSPSSAEEFAYFFRETAQLALANISA